MASYEITNSAYSTIRTQYDSKILMFEKGFFSFLPHLFKFRILYGLWCCCIVWIKTNNNNKWLFYDYFWPFFCQLYTHLSQNWGSDGHFDVLNRSKIWLVQRLWPKMQIFPFSFFCNFVQKLTFAFFVFLSFLS